MWLTRVAHSLLPSFTQIFFHSFILYFITTHSLLNHVCRGDCIPPFSPYPTDMKEIPSRYQLLTANDSLCMLSITHTSPFELQCSTLLSLSPAYTQLSKLHCIQLWLHIGICFLRRRKQPETLFFLTRFLNVIRINCILDLFLFPPWQSYPPHVTGRDLS
jgi:hypothetical protein